MVRTPANIEEREASRNAAVASTVTVISRTPISTLPACIPAMPNFAINRSTSRSSRSPEPRGRVRISGCLLAMDRAVEPDFPRTRSTRLLTASLVMRAL
ncbi:MAG TPA: hypothetical protein VGI78_02415 [Acetobacteraceae bacterium]